MLSKVNSAAVDGITALHVTIEVDISPVKKDAPRTVIVGLPDSSVKESLSRIQAALNNSGITLSPQNIVVNLAPGDVRKEGTGFDLPIAIGIVAANMMLDGEPMRRNMILGELSLDGSVKPIRGALPIAILARSMGFDGLIVPRENAHEAAVVNNLKVYGVERLTDVIDFISGLRSLEPTEVDTRAEFYAHQGEFELDFVS